MKPARWLLLAVILTACSGAATPPGPPPTPGRIDPAPSPVPLPTDAPKPSPTPAPVLRQLTTGGCCAQPFWSTDGSQIQFIDKLGDDAPSGIWGVSVEGGAPQFVTDQMGLRSPDGTLIAYPEDGRAYVQRLSDSQRWAAPSGGRAISFSPDSRLLTWQLTAVDGTNDRRVVEVWVANVDGSEPRRLARLVGGSFSGWLPDGERLLVSGRERDSDELFLGTYRLSDGEVTVIARAPRLRGGTISPEGGWVLYQVTFSGDPAQDGVWVARTDGGESRRLEVFGAYRWRTEGELLVIPLEPGQPHRLLAVEAASGETRPLTDPAVTPLRVAGGDWAPSPDGRRVAFVSADDHNLWVLELPE